MSGIHRSTGWTMPLPGTMSLLTLLSEPLWRLTWTKYFSFCDVVLLMSLFFFVHMSHFPSLFRPHRMSFFHLLVHNFSKNLSLTIKIKRPEFPLSSVFSGSWLISVCCYRKGACFQHFYFNLFSLQPPELMKVHQIIWTYDILRVFSL